MTNDRRPDRRPSVLIIDDRYEEVRTLVDSLAQRLEVVFRLPNDVGSSDLAAADLVLVDYVLADWPELLALPFPTRPVNGSALLSVLRAHLDDPKLSGAPKAFTIHTGRLDIMPHISVPEKRLHVLARIVNVEWVFWKQHSDLSRIEQCISLADAIQRLPDEWLEDSDSTEAEVKRLLGIDDDRPWVWRAWLDIQRCRPPIHEFSVASDGLALLRWLLHRILPYPCFLLDQLQVATRLGITLESMVRLSQANSPLNERLSTTTYEGLLDNFLGKRWWRAGLESLLSSATEGQSFDREALRKFVSDLTDSKAEFIDVEHPVVALDESLLPTDVPINITDAVRISPDDWPGYADQAWAAKSLVSSNQRMLSLVDDPNFIP